MAGISHSLWWAVDQGLHRGSRHGQEAWGTAFVVLKQTITPIVNELSESECLSAGIFFF